MTIDRPHRIYSFTLLDYVGGVYSSIGHAQREARRMSREDYRRLYGHNMMREVDLDWHNGFAAAWYCVEPLGDAELSNILSKVETTSLRDFAAQEGIDLDGDDEAIKR